MAKILGALFIALVMAVVPARAQTVETVVGDWHGVLETPGGALTLVLTFKKGEEGSITGEMESVDQAPGQKIPLSRSELVDGKLIFEIAGVGAAYEGTWDSENDQWTGTFKQSGFEFPLVLKRGLPPAKPVIAGLDGTWESNFQRGERTLRIVLRVRTGDGGTVATFDVPDAAANNLPVSGLARDGDNVKFAIPSIGARFDGALDKTGEAMTGNWTFPGQPVIEITFSRTKETAQRDPRNRPQEPKEPYGYKAEDVTFDNPDAEGVTLAGTLTLPEGDGPFPVAVLISGSGPQDRNEDVFSHKPFLVLADHLTKAGIAVLRYDDRGVAQSTGDFNSATSADFATDANAAIRYLKTRPEIDQDAMGFVGHSEGGVIGPIAAVESEDLDYLVLLAAPGVHMKQLLLTQRRVIGMSQGVAEEEIRKTEPIISDIFDAVAQSTSKEDARERVRALLTSEVLAQLDLTEEQRELAVNQFTSDWLRYLLTYDPAEYLSRIDVPVLAVNGALDQQVDADENLPAIQAALAHNPDVTVLKLDRLNHMFQTAEEGTLGEYAQIEETFAPSAMALVSEWINERFGADQ